MGRQTSFPTILDSCKKIRIKKLKEWGFLVPDQNASSSINWSIDGEITGSISISVWMNMNAPSIRLNYVADGVKINYVVWMVSKPSNLGKGVIWYFRCPRTNKLCRNLYLVNGYFLHRQAFKGCYYEKQTFSSNGRFYDKFFREDNEAGEAYDIIHNKYFKKTYKGKPTRRYLKLSKRFDF
jgi:hypothetical protein